MSMRATITLERYKRNGGVERRKFQSSSFLLGLIQLLYCQHSTLSVSPLVVPTTWFGYTGDPWFQASQDAENLFMNAGGGKGNVPISYNEEHDRLGIILGTGTHAVTSDDRGLHKQLSTKMGSIGRSLLAPCAGTIYGIAFDGTNFYYVDQDSPTSQIYKIDAWTGVEVTHFAAPGTSYAYNRGLTFDGTYLWITGYDSGKSPTQRIYQISAVDGTPIQDWAAPANDDANGLTFDGTYLWIARNQSPAELYQYTLAGVQQSMITPPRAASGGYRGLAWDGTYLWGVSASPARSYGGYWTCQINPANGALIKEFPPFPAGYSTGSGYNWGLTWADDFLWQSIQRSGKHCLVQMRVDRKRFDYGGMEIVDDLAFANPNGTFTLRRYFTNKSGGTISISEIGLAAMQVATMIARDLVSPAVDVLNNETLKTEYTFQITV